MKNFAEIRASAARRGGTTVAVVSADAASVQAVVQGRQTGICDAVLIGQGDRIRPILEEYGGDPREFRFLEGEDDLSSASIAVELARNGAVGAILKGSLSTTSLMRAVLRRERGLRLERLLSDVRLCEHPYRPGCFLAVTDGGMNPRPTLYEKRAILENAVMVFHRLGHENPRVAVLCAAEKVEPGLPHTVEAAALKEMNRRGEITGCIVEGPISLDLAISTEAARQKGYVSAVAGQTDVLLGPTIEANNILGKSLVYFLGAVPGQVVVGARVPVLITSRADGPEVRLNSIALAVVVGAEP